MIEGDVLGRDGAGRDGAVLGIRDGRPTVPGGDVPGGDADVAGSDTAHIYYIYVRILIMASSSPGIHV